jgi:hypothetical protein
MHPRAVDIPPIIVMLLELMPLGCLMEHKIDIIKSIIDIKSESLSEFNANEPSRNTMVEVAMLSCFFRI